MQPLELIDKYYGKHDLAKKILLAHSHLVSRLATMIAKELTKTTPVDSSFVEEAALLHDIGMLYTDTPALGCYGKEPYIAHGILGAELLRKEGLSRHALICERHIGVGLSKKDIQAQGLSLPLRDMCPQTVEEEIVAYADLFYSKTKKGKRTVDMARGALARHGAYKVAIFDEWHKRFNPGT
jgi:uncharacterized protein